MENRINFGIDLGTTNSAIAKFVKGNVEVFTDPKATGTSTLPSVVYYKPDNIIVGSRARTFLARDAKNVFSTFKRKMGTTESFKVESLNQSKTPVELSAEVLKELKMFIRTGEQIDAVVITVPASFEFPQIKATQEAGYLAGFRQVLTLQEPVAASLAYAYKKKENDLKSGQWLVYDLGGGTFDIALMKLQDGEIKVLDHEGNNFLGGIEFDDLIVEKLMIPFLNKKYRFNDLEYESIKSKSNKNNSLYFKLLYLAEQAKMQLSALNSTEVELVNIVDDDKTEVDTVLIITRSEFEALIKDEVDKTIELIKKILVRKGLKSSDILFTLMVGGSTYIPYVRKRVEEILQIPNNCDIDPTTAIAIGAAYYAGSKDKNFTTEENRLNSHSLKVRFAYQKNSLDDEEMLAIRIDGNVEGLYYQITREDKGFDSGKKKLTTRISEDLPLVKESYNLFKFIILDEQNNIVDTEIELIGIAHGTPVFLDAPISHDFCIEVDNLEGIDDRTKPLLIFQKGSIPPLKWKRPLPLSKSLIKGTEDKLIIKILEGPHTSIVEALNIVAYLEITGKMIERDILKGTEIDIKVELSENNELKATAYLVMSNQEFNVPVAIKDRATIVGRLKDDVNSLTNKIEKEIKQAIEIEDYEMAKRLNELKPKIEELEITTNKIPDDDGSDKKFQVDDAKRKLAHQFHEITKHKQMSLLKAKYFEDKDWCKQIVDENGNDHDHKLFNDIVAREQVFLISITPIKITEAIDELIDLGSNILWRTPSFLEARFKRLIEKPQIFNDQEQAKVWIEAGHFAIQNKNYDKLREVNWGLISLTPKPPKGRDDYDDRIITGIRG